MNKLDLIAIRDYVPTDKSFIMATWLKGLYYGNDWFGCIDKDQYFRHYHEIIQRILTRPSVSVKIACLKDDPDVILAYSVYEGEVLHWVQSKAAWRNIKLATNLVPSNIKTVSHLTKVGKTLMYRKKFGFNPFLV